MGVVVGFIIGLITFVFFALILLIDSKIDYSSREITLQKYDNPNDNSYFLEAKVYFWQFNKIKEIMNRYCQNSIIKLSDGTLHRVLRFGVSTWKSQRIIVGEYLVDKTINVQNIIVNIANNGVINMSLTLDQKVENNQIYNELKKVTSQNEVSDLSILENLLNGKVVSKNSLDNLLEFLKKYEPLISGISNLITIISSILNAFK